MCLASWISVAIGLKKHFDVWEKMNIFPVLFIFFFFWETELTVHISLYFLIPFFFKSAYPFCFKPKLSNRNHLLLQVFVCLFSHLLCSHTFSDSNRAMLVRGSTMEVKGRKVLWLRGSVIFFCFIFSYIVLISEQWFCFIYLFFSSLTLYVKKGEK